jgi:uncharacterized protein YnzC (UPF0291/DUF896 family)
MAKFTGRGLYEGLSPHLQGITDQIINSINENAKKKRDQQALEQLYSLYNTANTNINERYKEESGTTLPNETTTQTMNIPAPPSQLPVQNVVGNNLSNRELAQSPIPRQGTQNFIEPKLSNGTTYNGSNIIPADLQNILKNLDTVNQNTNIPSKPTNIQKNLGNTYSYEEETPSDYLLGDVTEIPQGQRYQRGQQQLNDFISKGISNQDVDLGRLKILADVLSGQVEGLRPKERDIKEIDPTKAAGYYDESGRWVETRKPVTPKEELGNRYERVVKTLRDGKYGDWGQLKTPTEKGEIWEFIGKDKPEKNNGTGAGKQKEEKGLKDNTSKLIADLKNIDPYQRNSETGEYITDNKSQKIRKTPEDIKYEKDLTMENIKLQLLSPRTYEWMGNIEKLWGKDYLSPKELKNEAIKHAQAGGLTEEEQDDIAKYLKYYISIYPGLIK